jgi:hypothetical protein
MVDDKQDKSETILTEWMSPGQLVTVKQDCYGLKEKCFFEENMGETIEPWDNIKVTSDTIGMIVGFVGGWHTCMVIVAWGGDLGGLKLAISENKLKKATSGPK